MSQDATAECTKMGETQMKTTLALAAIGLTLASTAAMAAPNHRYDRDHRGGVSFSERIQISKARANLASVKRRAWADGKVSFVERLRIRTAENRLNRAIAQSRRS